MASRRINDLEVGLRSRVGAVVSELRRNGVDLLVYCTYRSPEEQARLYRKTRTFMEIEFKAQKFSERGFSFLADILMGVGPQRGILGRHVTFAGPGESWHQYRLAFDAAPIIDGKFLWNAYIEDAKRVMENLRPEWSKYGKAAKKYKFYWAGYWTNFQEFPHCQAMVGSNPLKILSPETIENCITCSGQTGLFK